VFNAGMKANSLVLAALAALFALPASAGARIIEVGGASATVQPSCPASPCEVVSRTTAFQLRVGAKRKLFVAPRDGRIVAWTITLGKPKKVQTEFFEENLGGASQAGITVMKTGDRSYARVLARSPLQSLTPYFGQTVQFPLATTLPVEKGNLVALTVPTWAPTLSLGLGKGNVWKASRDRDSCDDTQTQSAQTDINDLQQYKCKYRTARLAYSATLITTPEPPEED
jgi:hypothetical protein